MSGFPILDLVIGMIFVYFLLSIISSSVVEMLLTAAKARSKILEEWLTKIFDLPVVVGGSTKLLGQAILDHCSITALSADNEKKKRKDQNKNTGPSYIDAKNFTSALLEKITFDPNDPVSVANDLETFIDKIKDTDIISLDLKRTLLTYAYEARDKYKEASDKAASDVEMFKSNIEKWYDTSMDRLTGDLKRRYTRPFTLIVAAIAVLLMNADSLGIAKYLYSNPEARAHVAAQARLLADSSAQQMMASLNKVDASSAGTLQAAKADLNTSLQNIKTAQAALNEDLPFGWSANYFQTLIPYKLNKNTGQSEKDYGAALLAILSKLIGLAATTLAIMLGAPFWFDLLNKVSNLRGTGNKPASSSDTAPPSTPLATQPLSVNINTNRDEEAVG